ncbi:hypothetical protein HK101_004766 [Irineochytrium annulatum]|nr:hypothetical protein HK101_004766 [Irineochytrium annulatum]
MAIRNSWITADAHYRERFKGTPFADNFMGYFATIYMSSNLLCLCLFMLIGDQFKARIRVPLGILFQTVIFLFAVVLTATHDVDPGVYFVITCVLVSISALGAALITGVFAYASDFPPIYTQAISTGQGFAGLIPAVSVLVHLSSKSQPGEGGQMPTTSSSNSFAISSFVTILTGVGFALLQRPLSGYTPARDSDEDDGSVRNITPPIVDAALDDDLPDLDEVAETSDKQPVVSVLRQIQQDVIAILLTFVLTLGVYPAITSTVVSVKPSDFSSEIFVATGFVVFSIADIIGKSLPGWSRFNISNSKRLLAISLARFAFIPLLFLCNVTFTDAYGHRTKRVFPLWFGDEVFYCLQALLASSSGFLATNLLMRAPQAVESRLQHIAADICVFTLACGLASGSFLSVFLRNFLIISEPYS